jgi:seryl-tRNA synthetase
MLDIKLFRESPEIIRKSEIKRGHGTKFVDDVIKWDNSWRAALVKVEQLKAQRNKVSAEINQLKKQNKSATSKIKEMKTVAEDIQNQDNKIKQILIKRNTAGAQVGNILDPSVPIGKSDKDNIPIKFVGKPKKFNFIPKDHIELGQIHNLFDFETAAKISGARFVYFKNEAVILDMALQQFAIDYLRKKGFTLIWPPMMMNRSSLAGGVNLSEFNDQIYKIENQDLYLIGTSEHPLVALKKDKVLSEQELPLKIAAISSCFRKELGAHGRDDKGIFRVHQFNKVEQVMYCKPEDSSKYFAELQKNTEEIFKLLEVPFRVVNTCTADLGNKQSIMYDIEVWLPGQNAKKGEYREATSCSNCTLYQAVTLNTKYLNKTTGKKEYVHMLNNTGIATPRAIIAILENFQQKDGSIKIPKVLWKYTGFKEIKKK